MPFSRLLRMRSRTSAMSASRSTGFCSPMSPNCTGALGSGRADYLGDRIGRDHKATSSGRLGGVQHAVRGAHELLRSRALSSFVDRIAGGAHMRIVIVTLVSERLARIVYSP